MDNEESLKLSNSLILLMVITCGVSVANIYYNQPILGDLARYFNVSTKSIGLVSTFTQIGYGLGMLFIVPLGDIKERKSLIINMLFISTISLVLFGISMNFYWLLVSSFLVGFSSIITQLIVPFAASLANPNESGAVIGKVLSGALVGILLARTISGFVGSRFGFRIIFFSAALLMLLLSFTLKKLLPSSLPTSSDKYINIMGSLFSIFKNNSIVRSSSIIGAMMFASFSVFWTTLIFHLESPSYNLGAKEAGLFSLVGITGVLFTPLTGKLSDKKSPRFTVGLSIFVVILSYFVLLLFGENIFGLILGVILLDLGISSGQVSNQAMIHSLNSEAKNRFNTIFMFLYFSGGSIGSFLGTFSWNKFGWAGVCIAGLLLLFVALITYCTMRRKNN
ncbi:major facilitator transporter protein [Gottschalkia acidurici 9a]|uniref:Major facilitator transporter protein n=1 Tax=Gottschalkia acidurici (strain ATCC 7906 / DSM 604 / BCRC 14475 / CIP 104303 / KCTC 5404 / NCIMB 10678 / 9a) TaxID=1128398 RepID=K0AZA0_GOTA9|nr:MFS transporter [Gottschalkia acidurici]AFS79128.1 major facilitator transporter protein [Gottschalkia acidurici 9a]